MAKLINVIAAIVIGVGGVIVLFWILNWLVEQLPEKKPDPPSVSFAIKTESLNPLMPEYPNVYQTLTQLGIQNLMAPVVDPVTAMELQSQMAVDSNPQTAHGGPAEKQRPLSKQQGERSGERSGPKVG